MTQKFVPNHLKQYIVNQDYSSGHLEIIIADGMSDDGTRKIIQKFQNLLVEADNFPRATDDNSYKQFWLGIRKQGPEVLGIMKAILTELEKSIKALSQAQTQVLQLTQELEELKGVRGTLRK